MTFAINLKNLLPFAALAAFAFVLPSCSHGPAIQEFSDTASPSDEVAKLDSDMNSATALQVNVLAPRSFKKAQDSLEDSKESLAKQKDAKNTLLRVAEGRAYLNRANEFAQLSHNNIESVIVARQAAITAGAPGSMASEFRKADERLTDVTADIERNELDPAIEHRSALQLTYLDLELRSIKQARLGSAQATIADAKKEGAKEFAPRTLAIAEKTVQEADAFITANRHDNSGLTLRSEAARNSADHLLKITRDSKAGKQTSSEETALRMEGEQIKVADKQGQLVAKDKQLVNKQEQIDSKQILLVKGETARQELSAQNSDLESEKEFNQRFEEARAEFSKSEAEVYKQGNTLMIRLRGLEFPVSQAVLKGSNFPLLAKVQKVIASFGASSVIIEGHTDSNGDKLSNEKLSAARAQAVSQYFVANSVGSPMNIQAIGYGYQKPLATNKTVAGRAQNRRVDVLIRPDKTPATVSN